MSAVLPCLRTQVLSRSGAQGELKGCHLLVDLSGVGLSWREEVRERRAAFGRLWSGSFGDDAAMARLGAVVFGWLQLLSGAALLLGAVLDPAIAGATGAALLSAGSMVLLGVWAIWRRAHVGAPAYLVLQVAVLVTSLPFRGHVQVANLSTPVEYELLVPVLLCAVFCSRRWHVVVQLVVHLAAAGWLIWLRVGQAVPFRTALISAVITFGAVTFIVRLLRDLAHRALAAARLGEITDPLTSLANRRGMERYGDVLWRDLARRREPVAVLVIDIDHFKRVNDTQGHAAGDELIRRLSALLGTLVRAGDVAARLGGEEFLVLAATSAGGAAHLAERLRQRIEADLHPVTVSVGVHEARPEQRDILPTSLWQAVDLADQALYEAKRTGRNRVVSTPAIAV